MCYQSWKNVLSWDDSCRLFVCVALNDLSSDAVKMQKVSWCSGSRFSSWSCKGQNGYNDQSSEVKSNVFKYFGLVQATSEVQSCDHSQQPKHAPPHLCIRFFFWAEEIAAHTCFCSIVHQLVLERFTKQRREWMENNFEMNLVVVVKEFKCLWNIVVCDSELWLYCYFQIIEWLSKCVRVCVHGSQQLVYTYRDLSCH